MIKQALTAAPAVACADHEVPFVWQTEENNYDLGAVLAQVIEGEDRVIAFASRTLTDAEHYLERFKFPVITDHSS